MDLSSFAAILPGFLFEEAASLEGELIEMVEWKTVLEKIMAELKKEPQLMGKLESFIRASSAGNNFAFMSCLLTNSTVKKMIGEYASKCKQQIKMGTSGKKNAAKAASIRLQGNQLFAKKEYRLAFKMFTRGLMFAKDGDEETPLLYANRSAASFYIKQYDNALEDIERAFKFGYGKIKPTGKLLIRKGFSLLALGRDAEVKELLDANSPANDNEPDFAQWQQLKKESANVNRQIIKRAITMSQFQDVSKISTALTNNKVFRPHEQFPWLNAKIDLLYDAEKGYSLVSKEEMKYGEIVALSKPFANLDPKRDSYERCHYCMVPCFEIPKYFPDKEKLAIEPKLSPDSLRMVTPLACPECSNVLYCSEACRTAAWTAYHRLECSQMAILSKIDSKSHLALRVLYMFGSLDDTSPNQQMLDGFETMEDHLALMVNQETFPFVFSDSHPELSTLEMIMECILTGGFLLKLVQMSELLMEPRVQNIDDKEYIDQASKGLISLLFILYQVEANETVPFTDPTTDCTVSPSPVLSVDGMKSLLKHSCEATVATSTILRESLESNVKLLYATGDIPVGTGLTLAYHTKDHDTGERIFSRKLQLLLRYKFKCPCTRCIREERDCLELSDGVYYSVGCSVYYPIACSACGSLMVRVASKEEGDSSSVLDGSYRCSAKDGCNFKYSAQEMKGVYERIRKMMQVNRSVNNFTQETYRTLQPKVYQLKTAIESTASLLYGRSLFLAQLYAHLAMGYLVITMAPISNNYSGPLYGEFTSSTHTVHRGHLTSALLYTNKAIDIFESLKQGPGIQTHLSCHLGFLFKYLSWDPLRIEAPIIDEQLFELQVSIGQVKRRYEALLKMTAYDTMVASSLRDPK